MIAFDTNILIYACDHRDPIRRATALRLIDESLDAILLWQVAVEFIAASRKLASQGFKPEHAWQRLADFLELFTLAVPTEKVLEEAKRLHVTQGVSFWDAMIIGASVHAGVTRLYSEDLPGIEHASLRIINPFAA